MRILNLNLKAYDKNTSQKVRLQCVADFCNNNLVDVLLLQEGTWGLFGGNSIKTLSKMLNGNCYYYQEPTFGIWLMYQFQCGIISKYPIEYGNGICCKTKTDSFIDALWMPGRKRAIRVKTTIPDFGVVNFVTCHMDSDPVNSFYKAEQHKQLKNYVDMIKAESDAVIIGGDFNASSPYVRDFLEYNFYNPISRLTDGIWLSKNLRLVERNLVFDGIYVSDHFGLYVEIENDNV